LAATRSYRTSARGGPNRLRPRWNVTLCLQQIAPAHRQAFSLRQVRARIFFITRSASSGRLATTRVSDPWISVDGRPCPLADSEKKRTCSGNRSGIASMASVPYLACVQGFARQTARSRARFARPCTTALRHGCAHVAGNPCGEMSENPSHERTSHCRRFILASHVLTRG
jgi:hypothetical protein